MKKSFVLFVTLVILIACNKEKTDSPLLTSNNLHTLGALPETQETINAHMIPNAEFEKMSGKLKSGLPSSVDLSASVPPVKNQGAQGSCVAWAVGYYAKTFQEGLEEKWDITKIGNQYSPAWVYNQLNGGVDGGISINNALNLIVTKGCDTWLHFPYNENNWTKIPDVNSSAWAWHYEASQYYSLPNDINTIKTVLAQGNVVIFRTYVYPDFDNLNPQNPVYDNLTGAKRGQGGHALCMVGYDDARGAFKFVNSWGSDWGTWKDDKDPAKGKGYGWISYSLIPNVSGILSGFQGFVLVDKKNESLNLTYINDIVSGTYEIGLDKLGGHTWNSLPTSKYETRTIYGINYAGTLYFSGLTGSQIDVVENAYVRLEHYNFNGSFTGTIPRVN
jgi:hypothetical protein